MPSDSAKRTAGLIIGMGKPSLAVPDKKEEADEAEGQHAAAEEMISAFHSKDAVALTDALNSFLAQADMGEPEEVDDED